MANTLQTKLDAILTDKQTNLLPENLKKGVTVLGINGTFEGGSSRSNIKMFSSKTAMDADTDKQPGDVAILYNYTEQEMANEMRINGFILPDELPASLVPASYKEVFGNSGSSYDTDMYPDTLKLNTDGTIVFTIASSDKGGGMDITFYTKSGDKLVRSSSVGKYFEIDRNRPSGMSPNIPIWATISKYNTIDTANSIWNYVKPVVFNNFNVYQVIGSTYTMLPNMFTALPNQIVKDKVALTYNGVTTGTLDLSDYANKKVKFSNVVSGYNTNTKTYSDKAYVAVLDSTFNYKLGDKRFILFHRWGDGMGVQTVDVVGIYDDPNTVIQSNDDGSNFAITPNKIFKTGYNCLFNEASAEDIKSCYPVTEFTDNTETFNLFDNPFIIYTNCKVIDKDGNVLKEAGPKASTTLKGQHYVNLFGEIVEGTYEAAPINATEYNTAVTTTEEILGTTTENETEIL